MSYIQLERKDMIDNSNAKNIFCRPGDERALLSYSFKNVNNFYSLCSKLTEHDFLHPEHQMMYIVMKSIIDGGAEKFDGPMIINTAQDQGIIKNIGGPDYVQTIINMPLEEVNFDIYLGTKAIGSVFGGLRFNSVINVL